MPPSVGSGTLSSRPTGAGYTASYVYTNLGQIWQGPLNGQGTAQQYLYCNSAPHQLSGIYPTGTTCATKSTATPVYTASYDAWGNETSRTYNSTTATLSYDLLNRMTEYNAGTSGQEFYLYDASGNRVLKRSISGGSTKLTVYAYGLQELNYTGAGAFSSQIDYYSLAGHLIGSTNGTTTTYDLTDAEGSVLTTLSASAVLGEQTYGPYGNQRYVQGTLGTDKGYTGQFQDAVTGFDYYNARYYDPVMAQFLSADHVQGNAQGMDPYSYVNGNPETATDPTGQSSVENFGATSSGEGSTILDNTAVLFAHPLSGKTLQTKCHEGMTGGSCNIHDEGLCRGLTDAQCNPPKPKCDRQCQIDGAKSVASDASTTLWMWAVGMAGIATLIGWIGGLLLVKGGANIVSIAGIPLGITQVALGNLLIGFAASLAVIGTELGVLAARFGGQSSNADNKWNESNIESFRGDVNRVTDVFNTIESVMVIGGLTIGTATAAAAVGFQGLGFALGNAMGMLANTALIRPWANSVLSTEESALNCTVATSDGSNTCV